MITSQTKMALTPVVSYLASTYAYDPYHFAHENDIRDYTRSFKIQRDQSTLPGFLDVSEWQDVLPTIW